MKRALALLYLSAMLSGTALGEEGVINQPSISQKEVYLSNPTNTTLRFSFTAPSCTLAYQGSLNPDTYGTYYCENDDVLYFVVATNVPNQPLQVRNVSLRTSQRYEFFLEPGGAWNIRQMSAR